MSTLSDTRSDRRQYLITYSQVDEEKFPSRASFGEMLQTEFNSGTSVVKAKHWPCCREPHENGGFHYHCVVKMQAKPRGRCFSELALMAENDPKH